MGRIKKQRYLFQRKKVSFTQKIFEKGLNAASYILIGLKDFGGDFLQSFADSLPKRDPRFVLIKALFGSNHRRDFKKNTIEVNINRLKREGLIEETKDKKVYYLTQEGKELVAFIKNRYSILEKPWDGKIRLVIFDIPENKKSLREWLRQELFLMQYKSLQKSVYIGKYPIPDDLYQDLIENGIFDNIYIFTLENIDKKDRVIELLKD